MDAKRSQFAIKLLPSMADFAFLLPIGFLFGRMEGVKSLLTDCDTGWHIRTGEWILAHHGVPFRDIFSFSKAGAPWFAWEWLSDIGMAWLNAHGGLRSVVMATILLLCVIFGILFQLLRRKSNPVVAIGLVLLTTIGSSIHWLARPHIFTLLFVVLFYAGLERVREGKERMCGVPFLATLPFATVIWTNLHGGFFVGIVMIAAYGFADLLKLAFSPETGNRPALRKNAVRHFLAAMACLAASLVNPYFYHLHTHIAQYLADPFNAQHINEFLSLNFHHPVAPFVEVMMVLGAAAACWHLSRGRYVEPVLLLLWAHGALMAARNVPIFMIAAVLPVAGAMQEWIDLLPRMAVAGWVQTLARRFGRLGSQTAETDSIPRWHVVSAAGVMLVAAVLWAPNPPKKFRAEFDPKSYPAAALATLRSDPAARIFTHDEWGDYLIWTLYPNQRVFVDGRSDFYGDDFENKYIDVLNVKYDWEETLGRFGVDTILLSPSMPLAGAVKESSHWRVVYDDGVALVFRQATKTGAQTVSAAVTGSGAGRDREITKTEARDPAITVTKSKS